jgi:glycosyltransferase involved in cell wall biosynthesis
MRFLILTQYYPPEVGAAQARLGAMARELVRNNHSVEVVTSLPNYPLGAIFSGYRGKSYRRELCGGVTVHRVWSYASQGVGRGRIVNYLSFLLGSFFGMWKCKRPDYIFVEIPPLPLAIAGVVARFLWRVPLIVNVSDLWPDSAIEMGIIHNGLLADSVCYVERSTYIHAQYVCAVTSGILDTLRTKKNVPSEKILFLPNAVDTNLLKPEPPNNEMRKRLGLHAKEVIVYAGTHSIAHGLDVLLDAAELLRDDPTFHFVFVGAGSAKRKLMERARQSHLRNVSFFDPISPSEVAALYSIALCGIVSLLDIPILRSARHAKTLAVMACAKPVVMVSNSDSSLVQEANAGLVVSASEPRSIADAIQTLASNPSLAAELGRNGRRYVEEHCTWPPAIDRWISQLRAAGAQTLRAA